MNKSSFYHLMQNITKNCGAIMAKDCKRKTVLPGKKQLTPLP